MDSGCMWPKGLLCTEWQRVSGNFQRVEKEINEPRGAFRPPPCISHLLSKRCTNVSTDWPVCVGSDGGTCLPQVSQLKPSMAKKQMAKVMSDMSLMFSDRFTTQHVKRRWCLQNRRNKWSNQGAVAAVGRNGPSGTFTRGCRLEHLPGPCK